MIRATLDRIRADESGMTLIELLVVCMVSIVVVLALFLFQDITLRGTNRVFAKVDATQRARVTMETIVTRLRSSCVSENATPIYSTSPKLSDDNDLYFLSKYGSGANLTPELHQISLNETTDVLTDTTYTVTGGAAPNWTFSSTGTTRTLLDHVNRVGTTPIFRYYSYGIARDAGGNAYLDAAGNSYMMLLDGTGTMPTGTTTSTGGNVPANTIPANSPSPLAVPLSTANAKLTAAVQITMEVGAGGGLGNNTTLTDAPVTVQDTVVMRLTPVPSEGNLPTVPPCQ
jgi:Tfp pilus assembly protein PilE